MDYFHTKHIETMCIHLIYIDTLNTITLELTRDDDRRISVLLVNYYDKQMIYDLKVILHLIEPYVVFICVNIAQPCFVYATRADAVYKIT